jgi:uroporphyrinogen-III synthase
LSDLAAALLAPGAGPLLLASGEGQGMALAADLRARGFTVRRCVAYAAGPAASLPQAARAALAAGAIRAALFFSPLSARRFVTILQHDMPGEVVQGIEALAISHPTQAALTALPWRRIRVASHPNQEALLTLLQ